MKEKRGEDPSIVPFVLGVVWIDLVRVVVKVGLRAFSFVFSHAFIASCMVI